MLRILEVKCFMSLVRFNYADVSPIKLNGKRAVMDFVKQIFQQEEKKLEVINYIFCSDNYLLDINKRFLKHDFYTDIITFDLSVTCDTIGEVYISTDRVKDKF